MADIQCSGYATCWTGSRRDRRALRLAGALEGGENPLIENNKASECVIDSQSILTVTPGETCCVEYSHVVVDFVGCAMAVTGLPAAGTV